VRELALLTQAKPAKNPRTDAVRKLSVKLGKIIEIKCGGSRLVSHAELLAFQGALKTMSKDSALKLKKSIIKHGWIAPIFVWNNNNIIDGHGRMLILAELVKEGYIIDELPVVDIDAKNKKEAAKILLAINSKYQDITDEGLYQFMAEMDLAAIDLDDLAMPDIDLDIFKSGYFEGFEPVSADSQGRLDEKTKIKCPKCGNEFTT